MNVIKTVQLLSNCSSQFKKDKIINSTFGALEKIDSWYRSVSYIEIDDEKVADALRFSYATMFYYYDVPGFNYQIDVCADAAEALQMFQDSKLSK